MLFTPKIRKLNGGDSRVIAQQISRQYGGNAEDIGKQIANAYWGDPDELIKADIAKYTAAVAACTGGRTPAQNAKTYEGLSVGYSADWVTLDVAALEEGLPAKDILALLKPAGGTVANLDHTIVGMAKLADEPADRLQWEQSGHAQLATFLAQSGAFGRPALVPVQGPQKPKGEQ